MFVSVLISLRPAENGEGLEEQGLDHKQKVRYLENKGKHARNAFLLITILLTCVLMPVAEAAPAGTSESKTVSYAMKWIGAKYVSGATGSDGKKIDCAWLVYRVYRAAGATTYSYKKVMAIKSDKNVVKITKPRPGDMIVWQKDVKTSKKAYWLSAHVGIYIGGGKFIHPDPDTRKVIISKVSGVYSTGKPYYLHWNKK